MILTHLQRLIGGIYDLGVGYDVYDFLVTDRRTLPAQVRHRRTHEDLIISEPATAQPHEPGAEMAVSLYLDSGLIERLQREDPTVRLHEGNVADCWEALEGISHFLCVAWHAAHDRPVSILELELQAEVDKYVASYWLLRRQDPGRFPAELHRLLFERTHIDAASAEGREDLYRLASRYAGRYCRRLERELRRARTGPEDAVLAQLRRFYRLSGLRKRAHIDALH